MGIYQRTGNCIDESHKIRCQKTVGLILLTTLATFRHSPASFVQKQIPDLWLLTFDDHLRLAASGEGLAESQEVRAELRVGLRGRLGPLSKTRWV